MKRYVGAALLSGAVLLPLGRFTLVQSVNWAPLDMPLPDRSVSRQFRVDVPGRYEVAVRVDRPAGKSSRDEAECLLGFDWVECEGGDPALAIRWTVESDGGAVRCGAEPAGTRTVGRRSSDGRFTPAIAERWLGCFDADPRTRYTLRVHPLSSHAPLQRFNPRVMVLSSDALNRTQYSTTAAVWLTSLLTGMAGFLLVGSRR